MTTETYMTESEEFVVYHSSAAGIPEAHEEIGWYFEPRNYWGDVFSDAFPTPEEALAAAEQWEITEQREREYEGDSGMTVMGTRVVWQQGDQKSWEEDTPMTTETTTQTVSRITVATNPDSLFGSQDPEAEGYDYDASVDRFAELLWNRIHESYPTAEIEVSMQNVYANEVGVYLTPEAEMPTFGDANYDARQAAYDAQYDEAVAIQEHVTEMIGDVHQGDWAVALTSVEDGN